MGSEPGSARAPVASRIEHVTVYASGARVRRVARVRASGGVRFDDLPLALIDGSVRVEVEGPAVATMLRVGVTAPAAGEAAGEQPTAVRAARVRVAHAEAACARLAAALGALDEAPVIADDPSDEPPAAWGAVLAARGALVELRANRRLALAEQLAAAERERAEVLRALEVELTRDARATAARPAKLHEVRKHVDVDLSGEGELAIALEYQVAAARWAPSYVARLGEGDGVRLEMRAVIAQASGEDWTGVALRLSTAEPAWFEPLPELAPQKIGRRQDEPVRRGFRAPPRGADALYEGFDRAFPRRRTRARPMTAEMLEESTYDGALLPPEAPLADEVWDEDSSRAKLPYRAVDGGPYGELARAPAKAARRRSEPLMQKVRAQRGGAPAVGAAAPAPAQAMPAAAVSKTLAAPGGGGAMVPAAPLAAPAPRLDYGDLRMAPPASPMRGTLVAAPLALDHEQAARVAGATAAIAQLALPPGCAAGWTHAYDYAFASDGAIDVAADGAWHAVAVTACDTTAKLRHVAVPREQADVFRLASIVNRLDGPLLPGPIDVYDRGNFLVTSAAELTPPGGTVEVGLAVDPAVKIARNVEFHEEAAGMLRGALRLVHAIAIEVENLSARPLDLEVRERVPVAREGDDAIEVALGKVEPAWERFTPDARGPGAPRLRGGYRWRLAVPARGTRRLRATYEVKLAAKHELVGGNRREP